MNDECVVVIYYLVESELFDEMLSCEVVLFVEFCLGMVVIYFGSVEMLLCSVVLVEDLCGDDGYDECGDVILQLQWLEVKFDLMMVLLGCLVCQQIQDLFLCLLCWFWCGICLELGVCSGVSFGVFGVICLQLCDWLFDYIDLLVVVLVEVVNGLGVYYFWLCFEGLSDGLEMVLECYLFCLYCCQIVEVCCLC